MYKDNHNSRSFGRGIFTILAFILGFLLYMILRQKRKGSSQKLKREKRISYKKIERPKKVEKVKEMKNRKFTNRQEIIIEHLRKKGKIYPSELQDLLPDVSTRTVRRDMNSLEEKGLVKQKGATKSTYYVYIDN